MGGLNDDVALRVDVLDLRLRGFSPQHKDDGVGLGADLANDFIGECFPALALVRVGLAGTHREHGVEQQHRASGDPGSDPGAASSPSSHGGDPGSDAGSESGGDAGRDSHN